MRINGPTLPRSENGPRRVTVRPTCRCNSASDAVLKSGDVEVRCVQLVSARSSAVEIARRVLMWPNNPSSATRRTGGNDCNRDAPGGFAAAHGQAALSWRSPRLWPITVMFEEAPFRAVRSDHVNVIIATPNARCGFDDDGVILHTNRQ